MITIAPPPPAPPRSPATMVRKITPSDLVVYLSVRLRAAVIFAFLDLHLLTRLLYCRHRVHQHVHRHPVHAEPEPFAVQPRAVPVHQRAELPVAHRLLQRRRLRYPPARGLQLHHRNVSTWSWCLVRSCLVDALLLQATLLPYLTVLFFCAATTTPPRSAPPTWSSTSTMLSW